MSLPDVTVIIPTFNRLWSLPRAVASCRDPRVVTEIIVVDDGSSDGTWAWLQTQNDVVGLRQNNWGKGWAVNRALARARGEYVRFLDSDDWLLPDAMAGQLALARAEDVDVVAAGAEVFDETGHLMEHMPWVFCDDFIAQQLGECSSSHYSAYLFRRSFVEAIPHRTEYGARDDRLFIIEVAMAHPRVAIYPAPTLAHCHHSRERLQDTRGVRAIVTHFQHLTLYRKALLILEREGELTPRRKRAACCGLWKLAHWIAYTNLDEACDVAQWVFQLCPDFGPLAPGLLGTMYRRLGFRRTELLLSMRRRLLAPARRLLSALRIPSNSGRAGWPEAEAHATAHSLLRRT